MNPGATNPSVSTSGTTIEIASSSWTKKLIEPRPLAREVEIPKTDHGSHAWGCAKHESSFGFASCSRIEGVGGLEQRVDDCFPETDVRPSSQRLLDPGVHFMRRNLRGHLKAPRLRKSVH